MLMKILNRLRGQVTFRAESAFPERVLNLCGARNLAFWELRWESPASFVCSMRRADFAQLQEAARKLDCTLTVLKTQGIPYFLHRFRHRQALAAGLVACGVLLAASTFFIWEFDITGNHTVSDQRILRALEQNGVHRGTFGLFVDEETLRNHILLEIPELCWIAVNVSGCRADVQVRERVDPPERLDGLPPSNVVARRDGMVVEVHAHRGAVCAGPGTAVAPGQLLISGVEDTDTVGASVLAGTGSVIARTWYTLTAVTPLKVRRKQDTGREKRRYSLIVGAHRLKFFSNSSVEGANCDRIIHQHPWTLFGMPLPVTVRTECCHFYTVVPEELSQKEAERRMKTVLTAFLEEQVAPYGTVSSTLVSSRRRGDQLWVTLQAECREEIGQRVPLYTEGDAGEI